MLLSHKKRERVRQCSDQIKRALAVGFVYFRYCRAKYRYRRAQRRRGSGSGSGVRYEKDTVEYCTTR